jgi:hypothetical protein
MSILKRTEGDAILLHLVFAAVALLALIIPSAMPVGPRLYGLVILYNIMVPVVAWRRRHHEWLMLWLFLVPLSLLQIFPDWFLASELGVIIFPDTGSSRIGDIPLFMGGLWTIPLFIIVLTGRRIEARFTRKLALLSVCIASAILFVGSEAILWQIPIWHATGVTVIFHVAIYLIIPEILLGLSTFLAFEASYLRALWYRLGAAFTVMIIYLGNLCFFYFVVEHLLLR